MAKKYDIRWSVFVRFLRTWLPQAPAALVYVMTISQSWDLPIWVVPVLVFVGAVATSLDKLFRELGWYEEVRDMVIGA